MRRTELESIRRGSTFASAAKVTFGLALVLLAGGVALVACERSPYGRGAGVLLLIWAFGALPAAWRLRRGP